LDTHWTCHWLANTPPPPPPPAAAAAAAAATDVQVKEPNIPPARASVHLQASFLSG